MEAITLGVSEGRTRDGDQTPELTVCPLRPHLGERGRPLSPCRPSFITGSSCRERSWATSIRENKGDAGRGEGAPSSREARAGHSSASVTAALHENSFDVYWGNNENFI